MLCCILFLFVSCLISESTSEVRATGCSLTQNVYQAWWWREIMNRSSQVQLSTRHPVLHPPNHTHVEQHPPLNPTTTFSFWSWRFWSSVTLRATGALYQRRHISSSILCHVVSSLIAFDTSRHSQMLYRPPLSVQLMARLGPQTWAFVVSYTPA